MFVKLTIDIVSRKIGMRHEGIFEYFIPSFVKNGNSNLIYESTMVFLIIQTN